MSSTAHMPYIIAGGGGGYWRSGRYVDASGCSHGDKFVNVMQAMGMELRHPGALHRSDRVADLREELAHRRRMTPR